MTDRELMEARELCERATPGLDNPGAAPGWCWRKHPTYSLYTVERVPSVVNLFCRAEDAHFIATSRTLVPRLLDEVERLRVLVGGRR